VRRNNARWLADWAYDHLAKGTTVHQIEDAIAQVPGISTHLARGFIPKNMLASVAKDYDLTSQGALGRYPPEPSLITGYGARKITNREGERETRTATFCPRREESVSWRRKLSIALATDQGSRRASGNEREPEGSA